MNKTARMNSAHINVLGWSSRSWLRGIGLSNGGTATKAGHGENEIQRG